MNGPRASRAFAVPAVDSSDWWPSPARHTSAPPARRDAWRTGPTTWSATSCHRFRCDSGCCRSRGASVSSLRAAPRSPRACSRSSPAPSSPCSEGARGGRGRPNRERGRGASGSEGRSSLNVHFHALVPDGVFEVEGEGVARFVPVPSPRDEELTAILERIVRRTAKALVGYDEAESEADALAALQAAEVDRRLRFPTRSRTRAARPSSTASRSTPGSGSTGAIARAWSGSAATLSGRPSPCAACRAPRTERSSTG